MHLRQRFELDTKAHRSSATSTEGYSERHLGRM